MSDPLFLNVGDAPSEHPSVEGWLAQLQWEKQILLDQALRNKQMMLKHAEHIRKLDRTMRVICELILEACPNSRP